MCVPSCVGGSGKEPAQLQLCCFRIFATATVSELSGLQTCQSVSSRSATTSSFCKQSRLLQAKQTHLHDWQSISHYQIIRSSADSATAYFCSSPHAVLLYEGSTSHLRQQKMAAAASTHTAAAPPAAAAAPEADPAHEVFDLVDDAGAIVGQESRSVCHKLGLLHRAVYVFVFDDKGRLLIQRRSDAKKIGPGQWDLSVAEHLSQGETFHQAAARGLHEELGIAAAVPQQPLGPMHKRSLVIPGHYIDNELVQSYRVDGWRGQVQWNPAEVSEVQFIDLPDLCRQMEAQPGKFTQWFREEVELLGWFCGPAAAAAAAEHN